MNGIGITGTVVTVPDVRFMGRRIFLESFGVLDKDGQKLSVALGQIMRERLLSQQSPNEPLITTVTMSGPVQP